ncbi:MAG: GNAT family N-acetyltransferase [Rectinemataceae bacterium]|nr:GNAT family N-acetyltransferase [Rectinemataceae bacterium]
MERCSIHNYEPRHFMQVSGLMTKSRRERRNRFPLLPANLEDASSSDRILEGTGDGVVALSDDGSLAGFLFAERREDPVWGTSMIAEVDKWALIPDVDPSTLARMYAAAFEPGTHGAFKHIVHCPAFDTAMLHAWFQLGFGMEQACAAARLDDMDAEYPTGGGLKIRRAAVGDEDILVELSPLIAATQAGAPVWAGAPAAYLADLREGFRGLTLDESALVLLAFRDGVAVGYQAWFPVQDSDSKPGPRGTVTEDAVELSVGATVPEERGTGVGRALTARGVAEARNRGYSVCFIDWRTTNPLSSAFWPARGFKPFEYRLVRRIDPLAL